MLGAISPASFEHGHQHEDEHLVTATPRYDTPGRAPVAQTTGATGTLLSLAPTHSIASSLLTDSSLAGIREKLIRYRICIPPFEHEHDDEHDVSAEALAKVEHDCSHHDLFIIARQGAMRRSAKSKKLMEIKNDLEQGRDHSEGGMKSLAFNHHCNEAHRHKCGPFSEGEPPFPAQSGKRRVLQSVKILFSCEDFPRIALLP